ncbi:Mitoguardin 2 [Lepeophtheirus salmonis]|uniref:Mitoguardin 2 n=1 Tax=Lepeophtheirus salmonis TaxID=72036 RepID=A0A7R8CT70_LEPSM|nr:Mitoguardin 2 [Lepeophtheirus salmonis]CAF2870821.1 Mitoguardin 2 [Lepeophtheirus salmonis]
MNLLEHHKWGSECLTNLYRYKYLKPILWITSGGLALYLATKFFRKKKNNYLECEKWPTSNHVKRRTISEDVVTDPHYNWPELLHAKSSETESNTGNNIATLSFGGELLESATKLQGQAEHLFIHQHSILHSEETQSFALSTFSNNQLLSVSTVESSSFVSAQDTIADLRDFEDLLIDEPNNNNVDESRHLLYLEAVQILNKKSIPYRSIRNEVVGVESEHEYLGKLHCIRLAFQHLMSQDNVKSWWIDKGREMLVGIMSKFHRDPKDFVISYNQIIEYLSVESNMTIMMEELEARNVNLSDLECPPSSVVAVMQNRWLSNGFKESALSTAIWSVLKAKKRLLKYPNGFKAQFYKVSEIITPLFAWGFFGPDEELNSLMHFFKDSSLGFIRDLYDFNKVCYQDVETMSQDITNLARNNFDSSTGLQRAMVFNHIILAVGISDLTTCNGISSSNRMDMRNRYLQAIVANGLQAENYRTDRRGSI